MFKAISLGFGVGKPWGESDHYDFILNYRTLLWRVQVKSTETFAESGYRIKGGGSAVDYRLDESDFLVATSFLRKSGTWSPFPLLSSTRTCASIPTWEAKDAGKSTVMPGISSNSPRCKRLRPSRTCCEQKAEPGAPSFLRFLREGGEFP